MDIDSSLDSFSIPPKKRPKTLNPNSNGELNQYDAEIDLRGKQSGLADDSESLICGICLSDNGNAIRGQIDSCDHFFCFVCIMEWAKVESRCPMCKRRFTTIRRPPKQGVFPSERLVNVAQCDQVYHLSGNTSIGTFDPYAQTQCSVCHSSANESLLLLCDLCDSAAHTFCVGLGSTVPEGDWFCHECVVSKIEHEKIQKDEEDVDQNLNGNFNEVKAAESDVIIANQNTSDDTNAIPADQTAVSIFNIVCNSDEPALACIRARSASVVHERNLQGERTQTRYREILTSNKSEKITQNGARTLSRCRNVHSYVQALRDNWNSFQNGSLRFSTTSTASSSSSFRCSGLANSPSSANDKKGRKNDYSDKTIAKNRCSYDVDKAWKMLDKAKSVKQVSLRTNSFRGVLKNPLYGGTSTRKTTDGSSSLHFSRRLLSNRELKNSCMSENRYKLYSPVMETGERLCTKWRMQTQSQSLNMSKAMSKSKDNQPNSLAESEPLSASSRKVQTSRAGNACHKNQKSLALKSSHISSQNVTDMRDGSGSSVTPIMSVPESSESLKSIGKHEDAKSEILLLVKLNLKLLNGQKQLGKNGFKEVARIATHTILAACGFGQTRYVFQPIPSFVCGHSDSIEKLHKSTLKPNSCRECFYVFVKDVVNSVLSDKLAKPSAT